MDSKLVIILAYLFDGLQVPEVFLVCSEACGWLVEDTDLQPRRLLLQQPQAGPGHHVGGHHFSMLCSVFRINHRVPSPCLLSFAEQVFYQRREVLKLSALLGQTHVLCYNLKHLWVSANASSKYYHNYTWTFYITGDYDSSVWSFLTFVKVASNGFYWNLVWTHWAWVSRGEDRSEWHMTCCHHDDIMMTIDMTEDAGYK